MKYFSVLAAIVLAGAIPMAAGQVIITVETAKDSYIEGETIIISGKVDPVLDDTPILLNILLNGEIKEISQITPAQDGTYTERVVASGPNWRADGEYTIRAYYGEGNNVETTLQFAIERPSTTDIWVVDVGTSGTIDVEYTISGGEITDMRIDPEQISLFTTLATTRDGFVTMDVERRLIDATEEGSDSGFIVLIDNTQVPHTELTSDGDTRTIEIKFNEGDTNIQIIGTEIIPEFGAIAVLVLAAGTTAAVAVSRRISIV